MPNIFNTLPAKLKKQYKNNEYVIFLQLVSKFTENILKKYAT